MTIALETRSLTKRFGGLTAVDSVDLAIQENSIFSVIGPNGAGRQLSIIASPVSTNRKQAIFFFTGNRWSVCLQIRLRIEASRELPEYFACSPI